VAKAVLFNSVLAPYPHIHPILVLNGDTLVDVLAPTGNDTSADAGEAFGAVDVRGTAFEKRLIAEGFEAFGNASVESANQFAFSECQSHDTAERSAL
jgi:hypothetical protein